MDDPRFAPIMRHLDQTADLAGRVERIFKSTNIKVEDGRMDLENIAAAASRPKVHGQDLEHCIIEIHEVNGHVVYYVQPKTNVPPEKWAEHVVKPALGAVWDQLEVEGWSDVAPQPRAGNNYWVWGVLVRDITLNVMNQALYIKRIPQAFNREIARVLNLEGGA
jgi:hypothetical protein